MGRYYYSKKEEADGLIQISASFLNKRGYFRTGYISGTITWSMHREETGNARIISVIDAYNQYLILIYTQADRNSEVKKDFNYKIFLTTTPCNFGGKRYWFLCPLFMGGRCCGKRVGVLYVCGKYFGCRNCYNLSYKSRNQNRRCRDYSLRYAYTIEEKIEDIAMNMKRSYYAGKPTKDQKRIDKLSGKAFF